MTQKNMTEKRIYNHKKSLLKLGIITGISVSLLIGLALPSFGEFQLRIGNVNLDFSNFSSLWQSALPQLSKTLGNIEGLDKVGSLGLPDIATIEQEIEQEKGYEGWDEEQEFHRILADVLSKETFSHEGQTKSQKIKEALQEQIQQIEDDAYAAQGEVITQNVLKRIASQQHKQATIMGIVREDLSDLNQKQDANNLLLSNVSKTLDKGKRLEEEERAAQNRSRQQILGYMKLY